MTVFEEKSIGKAILRLGLPAMLAQLATLIYNTADTYFVSLTKNADQIAAVTLSTPILLIIMSIARAIGTDETNFSYTCDYLRYIFLGAPFIMLSSGYAHLFRSAALIREATVGVIIGNVLNIILDWLFIVPFGMGTAGAALATSLGYVASTGYYLWCVFSQKRKGNDTVSASPKGLLKSGKIAGSVVKIGVPGAMITVLLSVSNIVLNSHVAGYGSDVVACYGIAYKLSLFAVLLSVGLAQGIAPLFGFCYGAKQMDRLRRSVYIGAAFDILLGVFFAAAFALFGRVLTAFFLDDGKLIAQSASFLGVIGLSAPLVGVINIVSGPGQGSQLHNHHPAPKCGFVHSGRYPDGCLVESAGRDCNAAGS